MKPKYSIHAKISSEHFTKNNKMHTENVYTLHWKIQFDFCYVCEFLNLAKQKRKRKQTNVEIVRWIKTKNVQKNCNEKNV